METEFEAKFYPTPDNVRKLLEEKGAKLLIPERLMKRILFHVKENPQIQGHYIRVRDEGEKITLSTKTHALEGGEVSDQKEIQVEVSDFNKTVEIIKSAGLMISNYQENKRETWELDNAEVVIDTWPGLETYLEIEASSEEHVKRVVEKLGLNWNTKRITSNMEIYMEMYNLNEKQVLEKLAHITFEENPFEGMERKSLDD